jgi:acyl-CoA synthetase (AMP-forming)/AMP-acid ligase II
VAQGDNLMVGYWEDEEATRKVLRHEGLRTGDLARIDEDGFITIVGRANDLIKSGAYRIHPQEIESAIAEVAGVAEVAVVGMPDPLWGESPVAFVVASSGGDDLVRRVSEHCRQRLSRFKQPRGVEVVESLPKTSSGKVKRALLKSAVMTTAEAGRL